MSRKGADFGYIAKRHGTLAERRETERRRTRAKRARNFQRDMDLARAMREAGLL